MFFFLCVLSQSVHFRFILYRKKWSDASKDGIFTVCCF